MSNYTKATNFATKDTLSTGDSNKIVKGTEIDNEFNAVSGAISSKADLASPALTGTPTAPTATAGSNTTQLATAAFVTGAVSDNNTAERIATATLTNKTLTAPVISGGTINNAVIGGTTAAAGTFTTATVTTVALGSNWTVTVSSGKLVFQVSGVSKASIDSSGNLIVTGNITAYGTP
jgi:hypothetical protein